MSAVGRVKRKFKIEENKIYTIRKLRNVEIEEFRNLINRFLNQFLTESEFKLITEANSLVANFHCRGYKYTNQDFSMLKEAARIINLKIPLYIRKNIEIYETAHGIKTIWGDYDFNNLRGENYKLKSYE